MAGGIVERVQLVGARGNFTGAIEPLRRSAELSHNRNWRSLAELAKAYDMSGRPVDAVRAAEQAVAAAEESRAGNLDALRKALALYRQRAGNSR